MNYELLGILKNKLSYEKFRDLYFPGPEGCPHAIAGEFYEDYVNSNCSFKQYVRSTTTEAI